MDQSCYPKGINNKNNKNNKNITKNMMTYK